MRRPKDAIVYPLEPLLAAIGTPVTGGRIAHASDVLGVPTRTLNRWAHYGLVEQDADRLACHLGRHPSEIWPDFGKRDA